ncbi:hypothetical protein QVD17_32806 [Tagetes erecta]|uniref:SIAH-type domain-containing protein n=1 Tax=Tagetes erecta TaxID=13708 RepID=A0AAD8JW39_TARER|nr:hypothetical protein QVD17_32806 [Tagetes erecta]
MAAEGNENKKKNVLSRIVSLMLRSMTGYKSKRQQPPLTTGLIPKAAITKDASRDVVLGAKRSISIDPDLLKSYSPTLCKYQCEKEGHLEMNLCGSCFNKQGLKTCQESNVCCKNQSLDDANLYLQCEKGQTDANKQSEEMCEVECKNKSLGCNKTLVNYNEKAHHEERCAHTQCFCPLWITCGFSDSSNKVYDHFKTHRVFDSSFTYAVPFFLWVGEGEKRMLLQEVNDGVIFILNNHGAQRVFSVDCIGPPTLNKAFTYSLSVKYQGTHWSLKSTPEVYSNRDQEDAAAAPKKPFLYLTNLDCIGPFPIQICIHRQQG